MMKDVYILGSLCMTSSSLVSGYQNSRRTHGLCLQLRIQNSLQYDTFLSPSPIIKIQFNSLFKGLPTASGVL
jgi:hypothetical protein